LYRKASSRGKRVKSETAGSSGQVRPLVGGWFCPFHSIARANILVINGD
jgi:hypothetical protein